MTAPRRPVVAIVPVARLDDAKSRLGEVLDAEERRDLVERLIRRTVAAVVAARGIDETIVVTPDDEVRSLALELGARPVRQRGRGLDGALRQARDEALAAGAEAMVIVPIDLPRVSRDAVEALVAPLIRPERPLVVLAPDRHGRGTNALVVAPPDAIELRFGPDSRDAHRRAAHDADAHYLEIDGALALDLDTPEDLLLAERVEAEAVDAV